MNRELKDKIAIVTGGAMGIGEATARELAAQGATVAIFDDSTRRLDLLSCGAITCADGDYRPRAGKSALLRRGNG